MEHTNLPEEETKNPVEDITEEQFLKDLYIFMKKRDTPIERIPNLGFKQIDLFVMFKTVNNLGGYHQVTSHQLWKQVYNVLGGNPRSTSAATCTRRHYERLLLPYECHLKGILINAVPHPKPYHDKNNSSGQRPSKRRLLSYQGSYSFQFDPYLHSLPVHYPQFYPPTQPFLPPIFSLPPSVLAHQPVPKPTAQFQPPTLDPNTDQSLKDLRRLAERHMSSFGQIEPLNLSTKASSSDSESPASSFSRPASNKSPKFLNKPSTLYAPRQSGAVRNEETSDSNEEDTAFLYPPKAKKANVVKAFTPSHSPERSSALTPEADKGAQKPSSPKSSSLLEQAEDKQAGQEERTPSVSDIQHRLPQPGEGRMEFEVPLSVLYKWIKLCGSPAMLRPSEDASGQRSCFDLNALPCSQIFSSKHQNSVEDLSQKSEGNSSSQSHLKSHKPFPSSSSMNGVWPHDPQDARRHWDNAQTRPSSGALRMDSSPLSDGQHEVQEAVQRGERKHPALLMNSSSMLELTSEELVKLKRIILSTS